MRPSGFGPLGWLTSALVFASIGGCATTLRRAPDAHIGPVTGLTLGGSFSCSQAGVKTPTGWIVPEFRPVAIDANDEWILVGGGIPGEAGQLALYTHAGASIRSARLRDDLVYSVCIHPDGHRALIGCADGSVSWISLPSLSEDTVLTSHTAPCRTVGISNDGNSWASGGLDGLVYLYSGGQASVLKEHTAGVECLAFYETTLYSGARDGKVRRHDSGAFTRTYQRLGDAVQAIAVSARGIVAGLDDGRLLRLHPDRATSESLAEGPPVFSLAWAEDSLVVGSTASLTIIHPN